MVAGVEDLVRLDVEKLSLPPGGWRARPLAELQGAKIGCEYDGRNGRLAVARKSMSQRLIRDCRRDSVRFKDSPPLVSVDDLACLNAGPTSKNLRIGLPLDMQKSLGHLAMTMGAAPSAGCTEVEETLLAELMRAPAP